MNNVLVLEKLIVFLHYLLFMAKVVSTVDVDDQQVHNQ